MDSTPDAPEPGPAEEPAPKTCARCGAPFGCVDPSFETCGACRAGRASPQSGGKTHDFTAFVCDNGTGWAAGEKPGQYRKMRKKT